MIKANFSGADRYYVKNQHWDITAMGDGSGNIIKWYDYDVFGQEYDPDPADPNPFRYAGEYYDGESGNIYLRNRYYSPGTGRFITEDPIRDGLNWYVYCGNNPANCWDPLGLDVWIYYGEAQEESAKLDAEDFVQIYGKDKVHLVPVKSKKDLIDGWKEMGANGESIDVVEINLHGGPNSISTPDGSVSASDLSTDKEIDTILLLTCNGGHLDVENNTAKVLLHYNDVDQIIASDGEVLFWKRTLDYTSDVDDEFKKYANRAGSGRTQNEGFIRYTKENLISNNLINNLMPVAPVLASCLSMIQPLTAYTRRQPIGYEFKTVLDMVNSPD